MEPSDIENGHVIAYFPKRGFGFAQLGPERVFFHMQNCQMVIGTRDHPIITDAPCRKEPTAKPTPSEIILVVRGRNTEKGPWALTWGFRPTKCRPEELTCSDFIRDCIGGKIYILRWTVQGNRRTFVVAEEARLESAVLRGDYLTLSRASRKVGMDRKKIHPVVGSVEEMFDIRGATHKRGSRGGYMISILSGHVEVQIILHPEE